MTDAQSSLSGAPQPKNYPQYLRKIGLVVSDNSGNGLDLSNLRIKFHVEGMSFDRPKTAIIRVYNLATNTQNQIKAEFQNVMLQAGYENGAYGIIFQGTVMRLETGRESAIDSYLEIQASDSDIAHTFTFLSQTLAAGATQKDKADAIAKAMQQNKAIKSFDTGALAGQTGGVIPRGTVLYGLAPAYLNDIAASTNTSWFIEDGQLKFVSNTGYLPGEAVVLNSQTGMVGIPKSTISGIEVTTLLNPNFQIGTRVQIDNSEINQTQQNMIKGTNGESVPPGFPAYGDFQLFATVTNDGIYRALVITHYGDSRGNDWYSKLICLALDASAPAAKSVQAYG